MIEGKRGCGHRKIGGTYLVCDGFALPCDRLPFEIKNCPTCGGGIKFSRGFTWINWKDYAGEHNPCKDSKNCYVCYPKDQPYGLMWVGNMFYTPSSFIQEVNRMGASKRIATIPKGLELGKTIILVAHLKTILERVDSKNTLTGKEITEKPGIFYAFIPTRIEKIYSREQAKNLTNKKLESLEKKGITPLLAKRVDKDGNVLETEKIEIGKDIKPTKSFW